MVTASRAGVLIAFLLAAVQPVSTQRATFHAAIGDVSIEATIEPTGSSTVALGYPGGDVRPLDKRVLFMVGDALAYGDSRLMLFTRERSHRAAIVNVASSTIVDELSFGAAAVSPTGQFIAYDAFVPRWAEASALYLVYDVSQTPAANRMPKERRRTAVHKSYDHGWPVYPPDNVAGRTYQTPTYAIRAEAAAWSSATVTQPMHRRVSPLTWVGETQLAFVDESAGVLTAVVADVAAGVSRPIVKTRVLDLAAGDRFTIDGLARLPDRNGVMIVQLKLRTRLDSRTVEIFVR
jgi:hypothetical protein